MEIATVKMELKTSSTYPKPFVVEAAGDHRQTLVLLHGRSSNGEKFGQAFLSSQLAPVPGVSSGPLTIASALPNTKFIFPTAQKRRARSYNRATINQWFDNVPLHEQDEGAKEEAEWQLEGLQQSGEFLMEIINEQVNQMGSSNVFIGGLSQGCAMSLHLLLSYEGQRGPLGGYVGMSGWLPFVDVMEDLLQTAGEGEGEEYDDEDPFARSDSDSDDGEARTSSNEKVSWNGDSSLWSAAVKVRDFVRDNMDLDSMPKSRQPSFMKTAAFLGHGINDDKVVVERGRRAAELLRGVGVQVVWKEYDEGHWYKVPDEIDDIVEFLQDRIRISSVEQL